MRIRIGTLVWVGLVVCLLVLLGGARPAHADRKAELKAKTFYLEGQKAYDIGDFPRAIDNFKKAYDAASKPGLLFNIAQAYRLSGDGKQALFFYRNYLSLMPDAANRPDVEDWIAKIEAEAAAATVTVKVPPPVDPTTMTDEPLEPGLTPGSDPNRIPDPSDVANGSDTGRDVGTAPPAGTPSDDGGSKPIYKKWWFWTGVGVVVVGATAAALLATRSSGPDYPDTYFDTVEAF